MPRHHSILLIVHRDPHQVLRLVDRLRDPRVDLWMHVDSKVDQSPFRAEGVRQIESRCSVSWSGFGCVRATLAWLRAARKDPTLSRFTLLTGQDYPLRPIEAIVSELELGPDIRMDRSNDEDHQRWRYEKFRLYPGEHAPLPRLLFRAGRKFWYRDRSCRTLPEGLRFARGHAYWTLGRQAVDWIVEFLESRPDVERFFQHTFAPDEMFFHTLLESSPFRGRFSPGVHHMDWSQGGAHPKWLGQEDLPALRASGAFFARKFNADDPVLDALDGDLGCGAPLA